MDHALPDSESGKKLTPLGKLPKVRIIILNWNNLDDTLLCLESLYQSKYPSYEVIVIDNGSVENPQIILSKKYPQIIFIRNDINLGYTGGNNQGIQIALESEAEYIWLLNNDGVVLPDTLQNLIDSMQSDTRIGLISPVIYDHQREKMLYCGTVIQADSLKRKELRAIEEYNCLKQESPDRLCLWGTALLIRREVIERIGLLDERFFAYYEDVDYSLRTIDAGWRTAVETKAILLHENPSIKKKRILYYMTRNQYLLIKKHSLPKYRVRNIAEYFSNTLIQAGSYRKEKAGNESSFYILDGLWNACRGQYGEWKKQEQMPGLLKTLLLWHPYLLGRIIRILFA
jgi:GT2 family glycosyltransferase